MESTPNKGKNFKIKKQPKIGFFEMNIRIGSEGPNGEIEPPQKLFNENKVV